MVARGKGGDVSGKGHNNENPGMKFGTDQKISDIRFSVRIIGCITPELDVLTVQIRRCLPELTLFKEHQPRFFASFLSFILLMISVSLGAKYNSK